MDSLHVVAGILLQLGGAALLRTSLADIRPWLLVAALELLNELHDVWIEQWPSLIMQAGEALKDLALTLLLPTLLLLVARREAASMRSGGHEIG